MSRRHQRHAKATRDRDTLVTDAAGAWTVHGLPAYHDVAIDITLAYTGSGSGTVTLYTVPRANPAAAHTAALSVAFAGPGTYTLAGTLPAGVFASLLSDSIGTLACTMI